MILPDCNGFPRLGRIIGIDWGARRTGVAVSDQAREFVFVRPPIVMQRGGGNVAEQIACMAAEEKAVGIVIGLPLRGDGSESETTAAVRRCATEITAYTDLPIMFIEENFTSLAAQEEMGMLRPDQLKQQLDSQSARIILENAIAILHRKTQ